MDYDQLPKNRVPLASPAVSHQVMPMPADDCPQLTIFAVPKLFAGAAETAQINAINSWKCLAPFAQLLIIGDDPAVAQAAQSLGVRHIAGVQTNRRGTPLLSSAFRLAHAHSDTPLLAYCNSDIILLPDFVTSIKRIMADHTLTEFMAIGRRTNLQVDRQIDFADRPQVERLISDGKTKGKLDSIVCKDFFVFPRSRFKTIPDFAVGRGNWDNWMVHEAKRLGVPVVSISRCTLLIHQNHGYSPTNLTRLASYVSGDEARENQRLAGGRHLISGSTCDWRLEPDALKPVSMNKLGLEFWSDFPRFMRLIAEFTRRR